MGSKHMQITHYFHATRRVLAALALCTASFLPVYSNGTQLWDAQIDEICSQILAQAGKIENTKERKQFLRELATCVLAEQLVGNMTPGQLVPVLAKEVGAGRLLQFHARHQDAVLHGTSITLVLCAAFLAYRKFALPADATRAQERDLFHSFFAPYVESFGEGIIDVLATPLQLLISPQETAWVKPVASAACLGLAGVAAIAAVRVIERRKRAKVLRHLFGDDPDKVVVLGGSDAE